jgi:hypothetical protein
MGIGGIVQFQPNDAAVFRSQMPPMEMMEIGGSFNSRLIARSPIHFQNVPDGNREMIQHQPMSNLILTDLDPLRPPGPAAPRRRSGFQLRGPSFNVTRLPPSFPARTRAHSGFLARWLPSLLILFYSELHYLFDQARRNTFLNRKLNRSL